MGLLLALAYQAFDVAGAAAFVVPPLMMRYVAKQHIDRSLEHVRQLRALNEQLATLPVENARLYREAEAALRVRDEFLSVAAHELKTPVTAVRGYAQLLLRQGAQGSVPEPTRLRQALQVMDRQSDRLARLVGHLLDVSRLEAGRLVLEPQLTDVARLVEDAIKYSPRGGPIDLELSTPDPNTLHLAVRDHGVGIPAESRPRIFERFYQVDPVRQHSSGMGLGLYITRQIVELHGGRIEVQAPPDGGTRVLVRLPLDPGQAALAAAAGGRPAGARRMPPDADLA